MQKIPIDETRYILFDDATNTSRVVVVAEAQEELRQAKANLVACQSTLAESRERLVSTEGLSIAQKEAIEQFNRGLSIEGREQEVLHWQNKITELENING